MPKSIYLQLISHLMKYAKAKKNREPRHFHLTSAYLLISPTRFYVAMILSIRSFIYFSNKTHIVLECSRSLVLKWLLFVLFTRKPLQTPINACTFLHPWNNEEPLELLKMEPSIVTYTQLTDMMLYSRIHSKDTHFLTCSKLCWFILFPSSIHRMCKVRKLLELLRIMTSLTAQQTI